MNRLLIVCVSLLGIVQTAGADPPATTELEGTWVGANLINADGTNSDDYAPKIHWTIQGEKFTYSSEKNSSTGKVKVDTSAKPKTIEAYATEGSGLSAEISGIYELDGDTLKVCYFSQIGAGRPDKFEGGGGRYLIVLRRVKP